MSMRPISITQVLSIGLLADAGVYVHLWAPRQNIPTKGTFVKFISRNEFLTRFDFSPRYDSATLPRLGYWLKTNIPYSRSLLHGILDCGLLTNRCD